jgi:hypothetical protein
VSSRKAEHPASVERPDTSRNTSRYASIGSMARAARLAFANIHLFEAMTTPVTFTQMLHRLLHAEAQGRAAKTVEIYGSS